MESAYRIRELEGRIEDLERETETLKEGQTADAAAQHEKAQAEREATSHRIRELEEQVIQLEHTK